MSEPLLRVDGLKIDFETEAAMVHAVRGVSFDIMPGQTVALVGESGSGKSVTALSILKLLPSVATYPAGSIWFKGKDLLALSDQEIRGVRGNAISMIFQEPMSSLNPVYRVGAQIGESLRLHRKMSKKDAEARAVQLLRQVGIPAPEQRVRDYPHSLSGGMRQRVMIAMALACEPKLLIADEPTTALDVTIQAQILTLLRDLQRDTGMSVMLITHDLGVVAEVADFVVVMYAGRVVETARTEELFANPQHPYTRGLMGSLPGVRKRSESATAKQQDGSRRRLALGLSLLRRKEPPMLEIRLFDEPRPLPPEPVEEQFAIQDRRHQRRTQSIAVGEVTRAPLSLYSQILAILQAQADAPVPALRQALEGADDRNVVIWLDGVEQRLEDGMVHLHGGDPGEIEIGEVAGGIERKQYRTRDAASTHHAGQPAVGELGRPLAKPEELRLKP